ncbi:MAG: ArsR/SmtB family transcription factor [Bacteroidota bacterium]
MRKVKIDGKTCIGPTQSQPEIQVLANRLRQSADELKHLSELLKVAGTETALKVLYLLSIEKELCVCDIADVLDMKVSAISHQLKKLSTYRLVVSERRGKTIFYSLKKNKFTQNLRNLFSTIDEVYADANKFSIFVTK